MKSFCSLVAVGALLLSTCPVRAQSEEDKPAKETHTVKGGPFRVEVELEGVFEADNVHEIILRPDVWSTLKVEKAVEQGTEVKKGEPILWLETKQIDREIKDLEFSRELGYLSIKQAETDLAALEKSVPLDLEDAERSERIAKEDWEFFRDINEDLRRRSAEESLKSSEYSLEYAQEELDQLEKMYKADDLTEETEEIILKRAQRSVDRSRFYLESARVRNQRTLEVELPRDKQQLKEKVVRAELSLAKTKATLPMTLQKSKIALEKLLTAQDRLDEKLEQMRADRELLTVKAPADGGVYYGQNDRGKWTTASALAKQLRPGGSVSANQVLMTIVPAAAKGFFRIDIPEKSVRYVKRETEGKLTPTAYPDASLPCIVTKVSLIPVKDGVFDGRIEFKSSDDAPLLLTGMTGKVTLVPYSKEDALTVPSSSVFTDETDDSRYVYIEEAGEARKQTVQTGETSGGKTEITEGLSAGDVILLKKPE